MGWFKSLFSGSKVKPVKPEERTLVRAIASGLRTQTQRRRRLVLHTYVKSHSPSVAGLKALVASGVSLDTTDGEGNTPFLISVRRDKESLARALADLGANVNARNRVLRTALHEAAYMGSLPLVKMCLTYGVALNAQDARGDTPLHLAAARGHADIAEFLLRSGARPDVENKQKHTAFAAAAEPLRRKMTKWWMETSGTFSHRR